MAATLKLFSAFLLLVFSVCELGSAQTCSLSNITIEQTETGPFVKGYKEYNVTISNNCVCSQSDLLLNCEGFSSAKTVDPSIFKQLDNGTYCLINDGKPVFQGYPIGFTYSWSAPFAFPAFKSQINCS